MRTGLRFGDREAMTGLPFMAATRLYSSQQGNRPDPQQPSLRQHAPPPPLPPSHQQETKLVQAGRRGRKKPQT